MHKSGYQISSFLDEIVTEEFTDSLHLMEYLNKNGLSSAGISDRNTVIRDVILGVNAVYNTLYSMPYENAQITNDEGEIVEIEIEENANLEIPENVVPASFHLVSFVGWKYHESQIQANDRGTGSSIEEFVDEILEGDQEAMERVKFGSLEEEELETEIYNPDPRN